MRGAVVVGLGRGHAPDQREPIHHLRELREDLADPHAGDRGVDRLELAADVGGRVGLGVERVEVRRAAREPDQDAALGLGRPGFRRPARRQQGTEPEEVVEAQAEGAEQADAEEGPAARAATGTWAGCWPAWSSGLPWIVSVAGSRRDSVVEGEFPRVEQRPEQVLGRLAEVRRLLQLGRPVRQLLGGRAAGRGSEGRGSRRSRRARGSRSSRLAR